MPWFLVFGVLIMEIAVIGNEDFALGFHAAGVSRTVTAEKDAHRQFEELMKAENVGIVVTEKETFDSLSERTREAVMTSVRPTFVVLAHDVSAEENLRLMIRRALGVDLWKREE